jgi:hypothetical protein
MSSIVIKDLPESVELDRKAMRAITGGGTGPRLALSSPIAPSFFQAPLSFTDVKLVPPILILAATCSRDSTRPGARLSGQAEA